MFCLLGSTVSPGSTALLFSVLFLLIVHCRSRSFVGSLSQQITVKSGSSGGSYAVYVVDNGAGRTRDLLLLKRDERQLILHFEGVKAAEWAQFSYCIPHMLGRHHNCDKETYVQMCSHAFHSDYIQSRTSFFYSIYHADIFAWSTYGHIYGMF